MHALVRRGSYQEHDQVKLGQHHDSCSRKRMCDKTINTNRVSSDKCDL